MTSKSNGNSTELSPSFTFGTSSYPEDSSEGQTIINHLSLVQATAMRVQESMAGYVDLNQLIHAGKQGLLDAASKFDTSEIAFSSYARHRIRGAILDHLRNEKQASSDGPEQHNDVAPRLLKVPTVKHSKKISVTSEPTGISTIKTLA